MREIIFRGKRLDNGEWVYGYLVVTKQNTYIVYANSYDDDVFLSIENIIIAVDHNTVGQYTGLNDKNETKIYEGDIISVNAYDFEEPSFDDIGEVIISVFGPAIRHENNILYLCDMQGSYNTDYFVDGNIYDNPELLEVE